MTIKNLTPIVFYILAIGTALVTVHYFTMRQYFGDTNMSIQDSASENGFSTPDETADSAPAHPRLTIERIIEIAHLADERAALIQPGYVFTGTHAEAAHAGITDARERKIFTTLFLDAFDDAIRTDRHGRVIAIESR